MQDELKAMERMSRDLADRTKRSHIANSQAFPNPPHGQGMTYHQWLVGQALAGLAEGERRQSSIIAGWAIDIANAVVNQLANQPPGDE